MDNIDNNYLVFAITLDDLQREALEKIGRILTDEEIDIAKKGLEFGLLTNIDVIYRTIFCEMIEK
jgi:hypothetical protein